MKTARVASKIKTVAVAAAVVFGVAGPMGAYSATAQGVNPFVDGQIPNVSAPDRKANPGERNQFRGQFGERKQTNPFAGEDRQPQNVDARLARYLVGKWQGQMNNGQGIRIAFLQDGRFVIANVGSDVALVGRYRVSNGRLQFRISNRCSISTNQCEPLGQTRTSTIGFRPVDGRTFSVADGTLRRVG